MLTGRSLTGGSTRRARGIIGAVALGGLLVPALAGSASAAAGTADPTGTLLPLQADPGQRAPTPNWAVTPSLAGSNPPVFYYNWSGYAATAKAPFTVVQSTYKQPAVTCPVAAAYTVFWVGFDGFTNGTVEQDGTLAYCNGKTPEYKSWWEMFPTNNINPVFTVAPGDTIKAVVTFQGGTYTMTVQDTTNGRHFTEKRTCAKGLTCSRDSAEWIVERPGYGGHNYAPLADWGTMNVPGDKAATGTAAPQPVKAFTNTPINMINLADSYYLAEVGALNAAGLSFPDTWENTQ